MEIHHQVISNGGSDFVIILSLLNMGFFGGFSHCSMMCGPIVLSQVSSKLQNTAINQFQGLQKFAKLSLISYHLGRITTYVFIALVGFLLRKNLDEIFGFKLLATLFLLIACLIFIRNFLAQNFDLFKNFDKKFGLKTNPLLRKILNLKIFSSASKLISRFFDQKIKNLSQKDNWVSGYFLGLILGFLPCGFLYGAFLLSFSSSSLFYAGFSMLLFGLATFPALFCVSLFGRSLILLREFRVIALIAQIFNIFILVKFLFAAISKIL